MKFTLTITDASPTELAQLLAGHLPISFAASAIPGTAIATTAASHDDDDNAPTNANAPAVDSTGLPHDERIHSKAKTQTDSGAWRKRKGVADSVVTAVEQELRARQPGAQQPMQMPPVHQPQQPMQMPPVHQPQQPPVGYPTLPGYPQQPGNVVPGHTLAPQMPYQPQPPVQQPPAAMPAGPMEFNTFMGYLTQKMQQIGTDGQVLVDAAYLGKITGEIATAFNTPLNVITDISNNPAMISYAVQLMQRDGKW